MTSNDLFALLASTSAALLAGLAFGYAHWIHREGNGQRRFMRWIGPVWGTVALWHVGIWTWAAFHHNFNTIPWLRPAGWLAYAIPALVLFRAISEDRQHRQQQHADEQLVRQMAVQVDRTLNG